MKSCTAFILSLWEYMDFLLTFRSSFSSASPYSRLRFLGAYPEQSTYSSADFLKRAIKWVSHRGVHVECIQTDNGFEFTNRFSPSKKNLLTLFEATAIQLHIRHKLIRPYTPRHNGKVERSHREDQKRFYDKHNFYSPADVPSPLAFSCRISSCLSCPKCLTNLHRRKKLIVQKVLAQPDRPPRRQRTPNCIWPSRQETAARAATVSPAPTLPVSRGEKGSWAAKFLPAMAGFAFA